MWSSWHYTGEDKRGKLYLVWRNIGSQIHIDIIHSEVPKARGPGG
jgi:hypothetical protein